MTPAHLAEIEARHAAAEEGPWRGCKDAECSCGYVFSKGGLAYVLQVIGPKNVDEMGCPDPHLNDESFKATFKFAAHSWQDISDLLALVKEQAAKLAEANAGLDQFAADIVGLREELDAEFARNKEQAAENAELRIKLRICEDRLKLAAPVGKEVW